MTVFNPSLLADLILKGYTHVFCLSIHDDKVILIQPLRKPNSVEIVTTTMGYLYEINHSTVHDMAAGAENVKFLLAEDLLFSGKKVK
jgi:uncharacterized membrane protein